MNERDEEMTGRALGHAIESQRVRETPFADSRLAAELEHPRGAIFPVFRLAAAFAVVVLAVGALYAASLRSTIPPTTTPTPSPSGSAPVVVPSTSPEPTGTPLPGRLNHSVVYCGRAGAPPLAVGVAGIDGATPGQRITQRLQALEKLQPLGPTQDGPCPMGFPSSARVATVAVTGDIATVDYSTQSSADWGRIATSPSDALVQEIVYTASEEPGVRRVRITQDGGTPAKIAPKSYPADARPITLTDPLAREDVLGYGVQAAARFQFDVGGASPAPAITRWSVDQVAPGLARFVIELPGVGAGAEPMVTVVAERNDERANPDLGKWQLVIDVAGAQHAAGTEIVERTPLRVIAITPVSGSGVGPTARYTLGLDDLRPWRVALIPGDTTRIVVDIGGGTSRVTQNLAVYSAEVSGHAIHVTGAARSFEAHVPWQVKDAGGAVVAQGNTIASIGTSAYFGTFDTEVAVPSNVSGNVTLEVFLTSARDGSITEIVSIPLVVR